MKKVLFSLSLLLSTNVYAQESQENIGNNQVFDYKLMESEHYKDTLLAEKSGDNPIVYCDKNNEICKNINRDTDMIFQFKIKPEYNHYRAIIEGSEDKHYNSYQIRSMMGTNNTKKLCRLSFINLYQVNDPLLMKVGDIKKIPVSFYQINEKKRLEYVLVERLK